MGNSSQSQTNQNINSIAKLTWKELETIYYLGVPSLKDYAGNLPDLFNKKEVRKSPSWTVESGSTAESAIVPRDNAKPDITIFNAPESESSKVGLTNTNQQTNSKPSTEKDSKQDNSQSRQKLMQSHVSTSPFAKLKSNVSAVIQASFSQSGASKTVQLPDSTVSNTSGMEDAWFVEPTQSAKTNLEQSSTDSETESNEIILNKQMTEAKAETQIEALTDSAIIDQNTKLPADSIGSSEPVINSNSIPTKEMPSQPLEFDLDSAIENAFGRMLESAKKKSSTSITSPTKPLGQTHAQTPGAPSMSVSVEQSVEQNTVQQSTIVEPQPIKSPEPEPSEPTTSPPAEPKLLTFSAETTMSFSAKEVELETQTESSTPDSDNEGGWMPVFGNEQSVKPSVLNDLAPIGESVPEISRDKEAENLIISTEALHNLIQDHIKHTAAQITDDGQGQSIGSGKEYEVWLNNPARSKFVGTAKSAEKSTDKPTETNNTSKSTSTYKPRVVPPEIRKSCLILGIRPENITHETVQECWKKAIALPGVHPDQGGDTEMAVYLNTAKDILMRWLDAQAPKLGKKFGQPKKE